jgi:hypothetical protein
MNQPIIRCGFLQKIREKVSTKVSGILKNLKINIKITHWARFVRDLFQQLTLDYLVY